MLATQQFPPGRPALIRQKPYCRKYALQLQPTTKPHLWGPLHNGWRFQHVDCVRRHRCFRGLGHVVITGVRQLGRSTGKSRRMFSACCRALTFASRNSERSRQHGVHCLGSHWPVTCEVMVPLEPHGYVIGALGGLLAPFINSLLLTNLNNSV